MNKKLVQLSMYLIGLATRPVSYAHTRARFSISRVISYTRVCLFATAVLLGMVLGLLAPGVAAAQAQGYNTVDTGLNAGVAAGIATTATREGKPMVEKARLSRADQALGVVVAPDSSLVAVSSGDNQVYVASTGIAPVYVSSLNGSVKKGDLLAPSPVEGVLMAASAGTKGIMGVALEDFPSKSQDFTVKGDDGQEVKTKVGLVKMNMDVKLTSNAEESNKSFLQKISETLVGQPVSTTQVVVAMIILLVLLFVVGGIVYGAISSSIISLGRNPLGKGIIMRGLGQISIVVFAVLAVGLAAVYVVLRI